MKTQTSAPHSILLFLFVFFFSTGVSAQTLKYDLYVKCKSIKAVKVVEGPFDTAEDIWAKLFFGAKLPAGVPKSNGANPALSFNDTLQRGAYEFLSDKQVGTSESAIEKTVLIAKNLSFNQVMNTTIDVGLRNVLDDFMDYEAGGVLKINYTCNECSRDKQRHYLIKENPGTVSSLQSLRASAARQFLKVGSDTRMELNYFEKVGDPGSSQVVVYFQIGVDVHN
jgi:hypothetical protein